MTRLITPNCNKVMTEEEKKEYKERIIRRNNPTCSYKADMIIINRLKNNKEFKMDYSNNLFTKNKEYVVYLTQNQYNYIYLYYRNKILNNNSIVIVYKYIIYNVVFKRIDREESTSNNNAVAKAVLKVTGITSDENKTTINQQ